MSDPDYKILSVIGDSIANGYFDLKNTGWVGRTVQKLQNDGPYGFYARNFAVSGDRIIDCLQRFRSQVVSNPGDCLIVACGVNDIARWGSRDSEYSLALSFRLECWEALLTEAKRVFSRIYVSQILPVNEQKASVRTDGSNQFYICSNDDISEYNGHLKNLCSKYSCDFVTYDDALKSVDWNGCLFDDVHPNEKGHELIAQRMYEILKKDFIDDHESCP
ncbi:MAG: GDSL-type esterase/lipase family protein [Pseudomonadota bacterium]